MLFICANRFLSLVNAPGIDLWILYHFLPGWELMAFTLTPDHMEGIAIAGLILSPVVILFFRQNWTNIRKLIGSEFLSRLRAWAQRINLKSWGFAFFFSILWFLAYFALFWIWFQDEAPKHLFPPQYGTSVDMSRVTDYFDSGLSSLSIIVGLFLFNTICIFIRALIFSITRDTGKNYFMSRHSLTIILTGLAIWFLIFASIQISEPRESEYFISNDDDWAEIRWQIIKSAFNSMSILPIILSIFVTPFLVLGFDRLTRRIIYYQTEKNILINSNDQIWRVIPAPNEHIRESLEFVFKTALVDEHSSSSQNSITSVELEDGGWEFWFNKTKRMTNPCRVYILRMVLIEGKAFVGIIGFHETDHKVELDRIAKAKMQNLAYSLNSIKAMNPTNRAIEFLRIQFDKDILAVLAKASSQSGYHADRDQNLSIESISIPDSFTIGKGNHVEATAIVERYLGTTEGRVYGMLTYIDKSTFRYLDMIPKSIDIRILTSVAWDEDKCVNRARRLSKNRPHVKIVIIFVEEEEKKAAYLHERYILANNLLIDFGTDLKDNALGSKHHTIRVVSPNTPEFNEKRKSFDELWTTSEKKLIVRTNKKIRKKILYEKGKWKNQK
ncbi:MAG: hypothetical protein ACXAB4_02715 [Candidatus Hodarchaeales archaeon]